MALPDTLLTYAGRLATFEFPQQVAKRRASNAKKKTAPNTVSWPHATPTPEQLAHAGFYHKPTANSADSVTCFLCQKSLDGWDAGDVPAVEHLAHVPECGWAINIGIEQRQNMDREEENPLNENMIEARRATFQNAWPHEKKKGWKCKVAKMVNAGWTYTPIPEADDCVTCFYCSVSLDGWEPKDDPWNEHQKRAPDCPFFHLIEESSKIQNSETKRTKTTRTSKSSRASAQSNASVISDGLSVASLEDIAMEEGDSALTVDSRTSNSGKGKKKGVKAKAAPKKTRKGTRKQDSSVIDSIVDEDVNTTMQETAQSKSGTATRGRARTGATSNASDSVVEALANPEESVIAPKATRQTKATERTSATSATKHLETDHTGEEHPTVTANTRGKKRTNDGIEKIDSSVVLEHQPRPTKAAPKASKNAAKQKERNEEPQELGGEEEAVAEDKKPARSAPKKKAPKTKGGKKNSIQQQGDEVEVPADVETREEQHLSVDARDHINANAEEEDPNTLQQRTPSKKHRELKASPSPQSSDAENHPPSARLSTAASGQQRSARHAQTPPVTVSTPVASPSKRNVIAGGLQSTNPWHAIDLATIFFLSPSSRALEDKENLSTREVIERLSSPEKQMTIEEWIKWNAERAEERLRNKCETLIGTFEREGLRALGAIEGIESV